MDALDTAALAIPLVAGPLAAWTVVKRGEQQRESKEEETLQRRLRDQADLAAPMILRGLLNEEDIERVYSYANEVRDGMAPDEEGGWVRCTPGHEKIFLHHGGRMRDAVWRTFPEVCPAVMSNARRDAFVAAARLDVVENILRAAARFARALRRVSQVHGRRWID